MMELRRGSLLLVTGATGFLGRNLCPYLPDRGYRLRALVRPTSDHAFLRPLGVELALGDVRDPGSVHRAMEGCQAVVHAAAKFRFWGDPAGFFATNVEGTCNVLEAALQTGVDRFVHISTLVVAGRPPENEVITEETPCHPIDPYQRSKLEGERLALTYHRDHGLPVVVLRPGAMYGPWGRYAFNRLFFEDPLMRGLAFRVHSGRHITFPVFVGDVVRAIDAALHRGRPGEIYNLCGPCITHRQVGETVERVLGRPIRWIPAPAWAMVGLAKVWTWLSRFTRREPHYPIGLYPYVFYDWRVSAEKAQRELGFEPTPLEEGVRRTLVWYQEMGLLKREKRRHIR
ncbi:MAG TPA: NAD-dependent epimerase/dehydratase family protein [Anaerolineae bacterium]|nr:NAD-dependent epimerase/dehydratase family protein [Anaerolineae bacterium]